MGTLTEIATGWFNFINAPQGHREMALTRLAKCEYCPYKEELGYAAASIISLARPGSSIYKCGRCGCALSAKVLSPGSICPDGKW